MIGDIPRFQRLLLAWYDRCRRPLPWRTPEGAPQSARPDPYHVLVSELMLQQTQVATVIPYFHRFLTQFPTVAHLADAPEESVLRLWQGLGYYARARNLQKAARRIVEDHGGQIPATFDAIHALPGVGRYTAGAIASIGFGLSAPILDGNVARVLARLDKIDADPKSTATINRLWQRAEAILPADRVGDFNSALMELGAIVCTPRAPSCLLCPVREQCQAFADGVQDRIPPPRKRAPTPLVRRWVFAVQVADHWLIERRPDSGRWAGLWQFPTFESDDAATLLGAPIADYHSLGTIRHALTHRRYEFLIFSCRALARPSWTRLPAQWILLKDLATVPMSKPHVTLGRMLINAQ